MPSTVAYFHKQLLVIKPNLPPLVCSSFHSILSINPIHFNDMNRRVALLLHLLLPEEEEVTLEPIFARKFGRKTPLEACQAIVSSPFVQKESKLPNTLCMRGPAALCCLLFVTLSISFGRLGHAQKAKFLFIHNITLGFKSDAAPSCLNFHLLCFPPLSFFLPHLILRVKWETFRILRLGGRNSSWVVD